jgi:DNA-binding LytR/AlgR family response regulator
MSAHQRGEIMEVKINIDHSLDTESVTLNIKELTPKIQQIIEELSRSEQTVIVYKDDELLFVEPKDIVAFSTRDTKVGVVLTDNTECTIKKKLADLEEEFASFEMIRISKSAIINTKQIKKFVMQTNSTILVEFKNGYTEYVSRRYVKNIKSYFGI